MTSLIQDISYYLPESYLDIPKLAKDRPEWDIEKTVEKTGIKRVYRSAPEETTVDMAVAASKNLIEKLSSEQRPDTVLFCTQTPDFLIPHCSSLLQDRVEFPSNIKCFDVNLGCSGFVYSLFILYGLLRSGLSRSALLVTADNYSKIINPNDKKTALIFSDGACCTLLGSPEKDPVFRFGNSGQDFEKIIYPMSGGNRKIKNRDFAESQFNKLGCFEMDGFAVFLFTMSVVVDEIRALMADAKKTINDIDHFVFHQASLLVLESISEKLNLPKEKVIIDISDVGNTTSSSIPIALSRADSSGKIQRGATLLVFGFGIGLSWGGAIFEY